jgi:hypothetical protein
VPVERRAADPGRCGDLRRGRAGVVREQPPRGLEDARAAALRIGASQAFRRILACHSLEIYTICVIWLIYSGQTSDFVLH